MTRLRDGDIRVVSRDLTEPSPLAAEVLDARPYAFLDDAPLEERRTRAVSMRRGLDPASAADIGRLDVDAIDRVCEEAWPDAANPDEVHDALVVLGFATTAEAIAGRGADPADVARKLASGERSGWSAHLDALVASGRATRFRTPGGGPVLWCAAERLAEIEAALGGGHADPPLALPEELRTAPGRDAALAELLRARLGCLGPVTAARLASDLGLTAVDVDVALVALEAEGCVLRGRFTPGAASLEWCERRLLARIHRYTLGRLRREIEPCIAGGIRPLPVRMAAGQARRPARGRRGARRRHRRARRVRGAGRGLGVGDLAGPDRGVYARHARPAVPRRPGIVGAPGASGARDAGAFVRADSIDPDCAFLPSGTAAGAAVARAGFDGW